VSTLLIVLIVVVILVVALAVGGAVATGRRSEAGADDLRARLAEADHRLAQAHAEDRGWHRETVETAAREAFQAAHPGEELADLVLVQVIDRPGTDDDEAVFQASTATGATHEVRLGRDQGAWVPA
jgi:type II secretory pathway pseudopilin PulG